MVQILPVRHLRTKLRTGSVGTSAQHKAASDCARVGRLTPHHDFHLKQLALAAGEVSEQAEHDPAAQKASMIMTPRPAPASCALRYRGSTVLPISATFIAPFRIAQAMSGPQSCSDQRPGLYMLVAREIAAFNIAYT